MKISENDPLVMSMEILGFPSMAVPLSIGLVCFMENPHENHHLGMVQKKKNNQNWMIHHHSGLALFCKTSIWGFPEMGDPQNCCLLLGENPIYKWMIWGYPYFAKHPHFMTIVSSSPASRHQSIELSQSHGALSFQGLGGLENRHWHFWRSFDQQKMQVVEQQHHGDL